MIILSGKMDSFRVYDYTTYYFYQKYISEQEYAQISFSTV